MFAFHRSTTIKNHKRTYCLNWKRTALRMMILIGALALLPLLPGDKITDAQAFCCDNYHPFCSGEGHGSIMRSALNFLNDNLWLVIQSGNTDQDMNHSDDRPRHFVGCYFTEATSYINGLYNEILDSFDNPNPETTLAITADRFGHLLHTAQDFYAHTGWVDRGILQ